MSTYNDILTAIRANPGRTQSDLRKLCGLPHRSTVYKATLTLVRCGYAECKEGRYYPTDRRGDYIPPNQVPEPWLPGPATILAPVVPADPLCMPERFAHNTMLALAAQQEILSLPLHDDDPHFKAKLAAKAQLATAQITAQSRADKTRLKGEIAAVSYFDELKAALEKYRRDHPRDDDAAARGEPNRAPG